MTLVLLDIDLRHSGPDEGRSEGLLEGWLLGRHDGVDVGWLVGCAEGPVEDLFDSLPEGRFNGIKLGCPDLLRLSFCNVVGQSETLRICMGFLIGVEDTKGFIEGTMLGNSMGWH